jgi:uncharacterized membrane protein YgcG
VGGIEDQYVVPAFKQGDYSQGILAGVGALAQVIAEDAKVTLAAGYTDPLFPVILPELRSIRQDPEFRRLFKLDK